MRGVMYERLSWSPACPTGPRPDHQPFRRDHRLQSRRPGAGICARAGASRAGGPSPAWAGRTVWVRGMAEPCPWWGGTTRLWQCADEPLILVADPAGQVAEPLPLSQPAPNALLAVLRGLPLLHDLVARSPTVPAFAPLHFRVRLRSLAAQAHGGRSPCYEAVLLAVPT